MHLRKGAWFRQVVAELKREGLTLGGPAVPRVVTSYCRKGVVVEIRGGNVLRVTYRNGRSQVNHGPQKFKVVEIVSASALSTDFPD